MNKITKFLIYLVFGIITLNLYTCTGKSNIYVLDFIADNQVTFYNTFMFGLVLFLSYLRTKIMENQPLIKTGKSYVINTNTGKTCVGTFNEKNQLWVVSSQGETINIPNKDVCTYSEFNQIK